MQLRRVRQGERGPGRGGGVRAGVPLTELHTGRLGFAQAAKLGRFSIAGPRDLARALPGWGGVYGFATVRPAGAFAGG